MMLTKALRASIALWAATVVPGNCQNALTNGTFDTDMSSWVNLGSDTGSIEWASLDASNAIDSGSLFVTNSSSDPLAIGAGAIQFDVPILGGRTYLFRMAAFVPGGQSVPADVTAEVQFFWDGVGDCDDYNGDHFYLPYIISRDNWEQSSRVVSAPPQATCVRVALEVYKHQTEGEFTAYFDDIELLETFFYNGFESGSLTGWQ